ncbi:MAG: MFS transporter [Proteobacteria bacterium]|nr:MFS transporter [Pseudomonadota bacterium]
MANETGSGLAGSMSRVLARFVRVEPREAAIVTVAFLLFFFVLGSYFAVRPVRETIATILGRQRVADLWLYTAGFALLIVPVYGWLVARIRRSLLLPCIYGVVAITLAVIVVLLSQTPDSEPVGVFFYVWISVLNLMLVSVFWSFLLEVFSSEQSRRLFGFIAAGGTLGALVGPLTTRLVVGPFGTAGVLYIGAAGFLGAIVCQRVLLRLWSSRPVWSPLPEAVPAAAVATPGSTRPQRDRSLGGNPFAGIITVLESRYLLGIALFVVLLSLVNTFLYFEQLRIVEESFPEITRRTEVFANIDILVQALTILSQVFLTGRIAMRLGLRTLLTIVPVAMVCGFLLLAASNVFAVIALALVIRRWGEYAFVRPGREMLFSRLDTEAKYKAKSFIDVPVYRLADYAGAQAKVAIEALGTSPVAVALVGAGVGAAWALNGWLLGRRYDQGAS